MRINGLIPILIAFMALALSPASPFAPSARATGCGMSTKDTWSPAPGVGAFVFVQACGFNPSSGFTSEFHNVTAWTNSTKVQAQSSDFYFEAEQYPCTMLSNCKTIYFKDMMTGTGVFPALSKTFNRSNVGCVVTNLSSLKVVYTPTNTNHTFMDFVQDIAPGASCNV